MDQKTRQDIVEQACDYIDAVNHGERVGQIIASAQSSAQAKIAQSPAQASTILEKLEKEIQRLNEEARQAAHRPTSRLNALAAVIDVPVGFDYKGHECRVVFGVRPEVRPACYGLGRHWMLGHTGPRGVSCRLLL